MKTKLNQKRREGYFLEEEYLEGKTPVDPNKAKDVIRRFCKKYDLILAT